MVNRVKIYTSLLIFLKSKVFSSATPYRECVALHARLVPLEVTVPVMVLPRTVPAYCAPPALKLI